MIGFWPPRGLVCAVLWMGSLGLAPGSCNAEQSSLRVTALRVTRPAIVGRFATAECTIRNEGKSSASAGAVSLEMVGRDFKTAAFAVAPPESSPPAVLRPHQAFTLRRFRRMDAVGQYSCRVILHDSQGHRIPLRFVDGRLASIPLQVIPPASAPEVRYLITDPHSNHVYRAGNTIRLQIMPLPSGGPDLRAQVGALEVSAGARPFAMTDPGKARELLLDRPDEGPTGFTADFWNVEAAKRYLELEIRFNSPVDLASFNLSGTNLNDQYSVRDCVATGMKSDGSTLRLPLVQLVENDHWTVLSAMSESVRLASLRLRISTPYKINITKLTLQGKNNADRRGTREDQITCRWQDFSGRPLSGLIPLKPFQRTAVTFPGKLQVGYYGLATTARIPGADNFRQEFGFVVLPREPGTGITVPAADPRLGIVHMDLGDPNLGNGWVKTLGDSFYDETRQSLDASAWRSAIKEREDRGFSELPLISGDDWSSDSTRPISQEQLQRLQTKMLHYFKADPAVRYWELGLEENLGYRGRGKDWPYYWPNLEAKARAVRQAAAMAGTKVQLIYQIAELDPASVEAFCKSAASFQFDILSLHPYAWPDFPPPEHWMPDYLIKVQALMARYHATKPIWFTEIGAPIDGNPGGFFGYPSSSVCDRGLSRREHAAYLVKCHLIAFQFGVEKVFWYNYRDRGNDPQFAEDHFGLVDYQGFPKPSYAAYGTLARMLRNKPIRGVALLAGMIRVLHFEGTDQECLVLWTTTAQKRVLSPGALGIRGARILEAADLMGKQVAIRGNEIHVSGEPLYIVLQTPEAARSRKN